MTVSPPNMSVFLQTFKRIFLISGTNIKLIKIFLKCSSKDLNKDFGVRQLERSQKECTENQVHGFQGKEGKFKFS